MSDDVIGPVEGAACFECGNDDPVEGHQLCLDCLEIVASDHDVNDLLIQCDALLSLILHRERTGLSEQTMSDLDSILSQLRPRTDEIVRIRGKAEL